jgi:hypothetical protein
MCWQLCTSRRSASVCRRRAIMYLETLGVCLSASCNYVPRDARRLFVGVVQLCTSRRSASVCRRRVVWHQEASLHLVLSSKSASRRSASVWSCNIVWHPYSHLPVCWSALWRLASWQPLPVFGIKRGRRIASIVSCGVPGLRFASLRIFCRRRDDKRPVTRHPYARLRFIQNVVSDSGRKASRRCAWVASVVSYRIPRLVAAIFRMLCRRRDARRRVANIVSHAMPMLASRPRNVKFYHITLIIVKYNFDYTSVTWIQI